MSRKWWDGGGGTFEKIKSNSIMKNVSVSASENVVFFLLLIAVIKRGTKNKFKLDHVGSLT